MPASTYMVAGSFRRSIMIHPTGLGACASSGSMDLTRLVTLSVMHRTIGIGRIKALRLGLLEFLFRVLEVVRVEIEGGLFLQPSASGAPAFDRMASSSAMRLPVLARLVFHRPCAVDAEFVDDFPEFLQADFEELLPLVDLVDLLLDEPPVQGRLQGRGVVGLQHGVHVEGERHAGVAEFPDPLGRVDPPA